MQLDSEARQLRALTSMLALERMLESLPPGCSLESDHVAALVGLVGDAVRDALPEARHMAGVND